MSGEVRQGVETSRAPASQRPHGMTLPGDASQLIGGQVTVNIDGQDVKVPLGTTILEAARQIGIRIPTLCYHHDLCLAGVCRICVVEVEGQRTLQAACSYPITGPLKIKTHTREGAAGAPAHPRPAAVDPLRRVLQLQAQQQLRAADAGQGVRRRFLPLRPCRPSRSARSRRVELLRRPRHEQVRPLPALRPHLHRPAGGGRPGGDRSRRQDQDLDLPGQAAGRRGLHQLRPVHQPLPDRRPARQRHVRRGLGAPSTTRPSTSSSRPRPARARASASASAASRGRR